MFKLSMLPPNDKFESIIILKQLLYTHRALAELKGFSDVIPNKNILINAAMINEAKNSSEIENIITTHDELYKAMSGAKQTGPSKEVINYRKALWKGYELVNQHGFISTNIIITIQSIIENSDAGIRRVPGTVLMNDRAKEVVYTPPKTYDEIMGFMTNLETYINQDDEIDDLVKLAIIHYQFESIHPFYDGNGRTGRIINILYLVLKGLLDSPILYLSKYINNNKQQYYANLQSVRDENDWESLIVYLLKGIEETAINTLVVMKNIINLISNVKLEIKEKLPKIYSKELVDVLFHEFYTKISYVEDGLGVSRKTASTYLIELEKAGILVSELVGRDKIYINHRLLELVKMADF